MLPLWAMLLALLFMLLVRGKYPWRAFVGVCAFGIGAHIAGDVITAFGTMVFAPVSYWRAQFPVTFIIDPYFTAIIVAGLIASMIWKTARKPAAIGLAVLAGYVGFQGWLHHRAVVIGETYAAEHRLDATRVEAIPQPFSPFNWMIVIPQKDAYEMAYVSLWRDTAPNTPPAGSSWLSQVSASYYPPALAAWQRVPRFGADETKMVEQLWRSDALSEFRQFAQFPAVYRVDRKKDGLCVWYNDLRFALSGRIMPFRFGVCQKNTDTVWRMFRLLSDNNGHEIVDALAR